jgi:hypothetical protein
MVNAAVWQHVVAIAASLVALAWLVRRSVKGGGKTTGPCASCPASRGLTAKPGRGSIHILPGSGAGPRATVPAELQRSGSSSSQS